MVESNYQILGLKNNASRHEIRSAFRELALKHHSDRGGHDESFIKIKQAFEDLKAGKKFPDSPDEHARKSKFVFDTKLTFAGGDVKTLTSGEISISSRVTD